MEILPLIQSNVIPLDVVLNDIYNHLWKIKSPLSDDLHEAIKHDHFHFKKTLLLYYRSDLFSHNIQDENYYLEWFLSNLTSVLNDNQLLINGVSDNLIRECPCMTIEILIHSFVYDKHTITKNIYTLWKLMTQEKKIKMYTESALLLS
jgi:hypothetical protein